MRQALLAAIFALALAAGTAPAVSVARAQDAPWTDTIVSVHTPPEAEPGADVRIVARLTTSGGAPIAGEELAVNGGEVTGRAMTDADGRASIVLEGAIPPGELALTVSFGGSTTRRLYPSTSAVIRVAVFSGAGMTLSIEAIGEVEFGSHPEIVVHATSASGQPEADIGVDLLVNGEKIGRLLTDGTGAGRVTMRRDLAAGAYTLTAEYKGSSSRGFGPARAESLFSILPGAIRVQTVPALPEARFALTHFSPAGVATDTQTVRTDDAGFVTFTITEHGGYALEALPVRDLDESRGMRAQFTRWSDDSFTAARLMYVRGSLELEAGYDTTALVGHAFKDLDGGVVDKSLVGPVTLTSSLGELIRIGAGEQAWLRASRVVRRLNGLESTRILYSIKNVQMEGSNVVNEYEQRFYAEPHKQVSITVSLFSMRITTSDAIFGFPVGSSVELVHTDGRKERLPLGENKEVRLYSLPRGEYKVKVIGGGISSSPPVALSRNQEVEIRVISYLDIALVGGTSLVIVVGLLAFGRFRLGSLIRRRFSQRPVELASIKQGHPR